MSNKENKKKKLRGEGRRVRSLDPMNYVAPYIMKTRTDSTNYIEGRFDVGKCDAYIKEKRAAGLTEFGYMHIIVAAYTRMLSQHPEINRFIRGQKIYARNCIEFMIVVKREMKVNAPETCVKLIFPPESTAEDIYKMLNSEIETARNSESSFDDTAKLLNYIPGLVLKSAMWFINLFDYFGWLPRKLTKLSPFHGSFAITSMASLGIPPIYHHLYNFGNIPVFLAFGNKYVVYEPKSDGSVEKFKYMDYRVTCDERIADGHAYSVAMRLLNHLVRNPELLDSPPEKVIEDIP
ncbi:MAG: hypothetical protein IJO64_00160 [Clostridia bacterium]|nr:hypothetical protein [Clostridia bacterium]